MPDYATYVTTMANEMVTSETNVEFVQILPTIIAYAENRLYRELDLLNAVIRDTSGFFTANNRNFNLPTSIGRFVVVNEINVLTPTGTTVDTGTRNPLLPVSQQVLDLIWPSNTAAAITTVPAQFAMVTDQSIVVGPPPGSNYNVEVVGTVQPTPLSSSNTTTYLSNYLWDIFIAASMVSASGYMRNYGSQADDGQMAQSWQSQYDKLMASAQTIMQRQRFAAPGWNSLSPNPIATPPRQ